MTQGHLYASGDGGQHTLRQVIHQVLGLRKSCVSLEAGARARHKVVGVEGLGVEQVELRIRELL